MSFVEEIEDSFRFLENSFGFKRACLRMDKWEKTWAPAVGCLKSDVGVLVRYDVRDSYLSIQLYHQLIQNFREITA